MVFAVLLRASVPGPDFVMPKAPVVAAVRVSVLPAATSMPLLATRTACLAELKVSEADKTPPASLTCPAAPIAASALTATMPLLMRRPVVALVAKVFAPVRMSLPGPVLMKSTPAAPLALRMPLKVTACCRFCTAKVRLRSVASLLRFRSRVKVSAS